MLGEKIYNLRKTRKISQEEFAELLNTSRQAISKWERNEAKPDIDKLILIAKLFNISVDYLLEYEIDDSNVEEFIDKLIVYCKNNEFKINVNDIRFWCTKHPNNFKLHAIAAEYLGIAYIENSKEEYLNLALYYIKKAIILHAPEYDNITSLNQLHLYVVQIYLMQHKYDLAKEYIEANKVYDSEVLLAKCNMSLGNYDSALKTASEIYLESTSDIINVSLIQATVLLKTKLVKEAYEMINWTISFINSIKNEESFFQGILCPFIYLKATCERLLNISSIETINTLKEAININVDYNVVSDVKSIKHYFGNPDEILYTDSNFENMFKEVIYQASKEDIYYNVLVDIYQELFGGNLND